ncbi:hypothetical protein D3C85_1705930 [compost metagenome]
MLQLRQVTCAENQTHQANQIGQGIAEAQMILCRQQRRAVGDGIAQRIASAYQDWG